MAYHFRYQKSESFEKQLEESLYVVIQQHDSHTAVLRFEERAEGKAAKQVWPSRYRLICTRTNSTADALEDEGYYIIFPTLEYSLLKEGGGSVLEIKVVQTIE